MHKKSFCLISSYFHLPCSVTLGGDGRQGWQLTPAVPQGHHGACCIDLIPDLRLRQIQHHIFKRFLTLDRGAGRQDESGNLERCVVLFWALIHAPCKHLKWIISMLLIEGFECMWDSIAVAQGEIICDPRKVIGRRKLAVSDPSQRELILCR